MSYSYIHSKYPKIWYIKVSNKMTYANSADTDQTAPEWAVKLESILKKQQYK